MRKTMLCVLVSILFSTMLMSRYIVQPVSSQGDLVGWWKFDEGSGSIAYDSSGYGNDGTIYGAIWVNGKYGKALQFDGVDDYVEVPDANSLDISGQIQISAWIKAVANTDYREIVDEGDAADFAMGYALRISAWSTDVPNAGPNGPGFANFGLFMGDAPWPENTFQINSWTRVDDDNWHFIKAVYSGTVMSMYVDDVLETTFTVSGVVHTNDYSLKIGRNIYTPERFFKGLIDDIKIYAGPPRPSVGGVVISVDKFGLLAPYIGLASTILVGAVATAIYVKRGKRRKEKQ